ncbi:MAG: hypothetical protein DME69_08000 [Verrucomicrobia bacterium]|nr:MAG: hypothetical protein DME69_08000 [Verrucomicrobiota bacterium]
MVWFGEGGRESPFCSIANGRFLAAHSADCFYLDLHGLIRLYVFLAYYPRNHLVMDDQPFLI